MSSARIDRGERRVRNSNQLISTAVQALMQMGEGAVKQADQIEVPVVFFLMMESADDMHFGASALYGFLTPFK